ncbi:hypothetical protein [Pseudoduganella buxea]|nr:hypothetical protein [Pseudoduganella buxea]
MDRPPPCAPGSSAMPGPLAWLLVFFNVGRAATRPAARPVAD